LLKLDFSNAFNTIRREVDLTLYSPRVAGTLLVCPHESLPSFGKHLLRSDGCVQEGDLLGPLLFFVSTMKLAHSMTSELNPWHSDNGTIGGELRDLLHDLDTVRRVGATFGLLLNEKMI
jgi:hypothetical protein